jgi:hypothetical protein
MLSAAPILGVRDVQATVDWLRQRPSCRRRRAVLRESAVRCDHLPCEICDEEYGMRDFCIETPDGDRIAFGSPLEAA